jgi:hypothetical protein
LLIHSNVPNKNIEGEISVAQVEIAEEIGLNVST